ncbi:tryptophan synthase subunit alpha [Pelagibacteraceae bacterium]|nr:tryptophan synthase subunit alpha [Pelagibacteraceae bacterium]
MKSEIQLVFEKCKREKRPALITYVVASDPNKKKSLEILKAIAKHADILEIGYAHSAPVADGPEIQTSANRAIKNGFKMKDVFQIVKSFKKSEKPKPIILMGYYNMIFQYGENKFLEDCKKVGVNGIICVDLPWPENKNFAKKCKKKSISFVQLLSPTTTSDRMKKIIKDSHDMIYYISMLSTTGGKLKVSAKKILQNYNKIKKINLKKNLVIGFGITDKTISSLKSANGLVVGSMLCKAITNSLKMKQNPVTMIDKIVYNLKRKII